MTNMESQQWKKVVLPKQNQSNVLEQKKLECQEFILQENKRFNSINGTRCPAIWDKVACWPSTPGGETAYQKCPDYIHNFLYNANASKVCNPDGNWFSNWQTSREWTNYTLCINDQTGTEMHFYTGHVPSLRYISLVGYSLSLVALVVAIFIMMKFKKLRCARNTLHLNLFASFVWRAVVSLSKSFLIVEESPLTESLLFASLVTDNSSWICRFFTLIFNFGMISNYSWIFVEGMYLHTLIFVAFFSETSGVYGFVLFGWIFPIVCVLSWVGVRATFENTGCWLIHSNRWSMWLIKGPLLITVLLNFFFFINIVRVLFTKLQSANNIDSRRHRHMKLAKSSLVLIPLFGVPYVIFLALNENACQSLELLKLYFEMIFNSFNGFIVACLYCFLNGEVKAELSKKWRKAKIRLTSRGANRRKTTMTRSMNSMNVQGVIHSNSYDTTALQEETIEDCLKNNEYKDVNHFAKKSNKIEMAVLSNIRKGGLRKPEDGFLTIDSKVEQIDEKTALSNQFDEQNDELDKETDQSHPLTSINNETHFNENNRETQLKSTCLESELFERGYDDDDASVFLDKSFPSISKETTNKIRCNSSEERNDIANKTNCV